MNDATILPLRESHTLANPRRTTLHDAVVDQNPARPADEPADEDRTGVSGG